MRTGKTLIAATIGVLAFMGHASADEPAGSSPAGQNNLHLAIALQGDQALLDIRAGVPQAIDRSVRQQIDAALALKGTTEDAAELPLQARSVLPQGTSAAES